MKESVGVPHTERHPAPHKSGSPIGFIYGRQQGHTPPSEFMTEPRVGLQAAGAWEVVLPAFEETTGQTPG